MKITVYTINNCPFCQQEKEYLSVNNFSFEEKNVEQNKEYLSEMLAASNNFAGVPFTVIEKDDGVKVPLKGFTKEEFDRELSSPQATPPPPAVPSEPAQPPPAAPEPVGEKPPEPPPPPVTPPPIEPPAPVRPEPVTNPEPTVVNPPMTASATVDAPVAAQSVPSTIPDSPAASPMGGNTAPKSTADDPALKSVLDNLQTLYGKDNGGQSQPTSSTPPQIPDFPMK